MSQCHQLQLTPTLPTLPTAPTNGQSKAGICIRLLHMWVAVEYLNESLSVVVVVCCVVVLRVAGSVSVFPGGDVEATFTSNKNRATFNCVLLDGSTPTPQIKSCK